MARITVVGHPGLDTLVFLPSAEIDLSADGYFTRNVDTVGGAAAYTARGLAALGHDVRLLGALGTDPAGAAISAALRAAGVRLDTFPDPAGSTRSVNLVHPDGRRTFFFDGGSHLTLEPPTDLVGQAVAGAELVFSSLANWSRHVVAAARAGGVRVAVDLQDVRAADDPYRRDFVMAADHLFASAAHLPDPVAAARQWLRAGPAATVVIGLGAAGALLITRAETGTDVHVLHQPIPRSELPIIDTTGAGDSLACGFLDGLLFAGLTAESALRRGQLLARITSSQVGGDALATRDDLRNLEATTG